MKRTWYNQAVKKSKFLLIALAWTFLATRLFLPPVALAQAPQAWGGVCTDDGTDSGVATIQGLECLLANVLTVAITGIGLAAFVMFIVASFRYMLSGGNSKGTETAKNTLTYAVVGIVVALSAFVILNLIAAFTGISIFTQFKIPTS